MRDAPFLGGVSMAFEIQPMHRKTCQRINEPGHAHALTFSCFRRQPFLTKDRSRTWLIEAIKRACRKRQFDLWAYVIMPEHVHLLVCPRERVYSVSMFLKSLKQSVAKKALGYVRKQAPGFLSRMEDLQPNGDVHYRFWQRGGGYDRNLTEPATVWAEVDYIHANPVRRGLCERPEDWPWSSAGEWREVGSGLLRIDRDSFPRTSEG
jgi:putative transposase